MNFNIDFISNRKATHHYSAHMKLRQGFRGSSSVSAGIGVWIAGVQLQQPGIQPEGVSGVGEKLRQPLSFLGRPVYFKLMILFYTFTKALGRRFDIFSSH